MLWPPRRALPRRPRGRTLLDAWRPRGGARSWRERIAQIFGPLRRRPGEIPERIPAPIPASRRSDRAAESIGGFVGTPDTARGHASSSSSTPAACATGGARHLLSGGARGVKKRGLPGPSSSSTCRPRRSTSTPSPEGGGPLPRSRPDRRLPGPLRRAWSGRRGEEPAPCGRPPAGTLHPFAWQASASGGWSPGAPGNPHDPGNPLDSGLGWPLGDREGRGGGGPAPAPAVVSPASYAPLSRAPVAALRRKEGAPGLPPARPVQGP